MLSCRGNGCLGLISSTFRSLKLSIKASEHTFDSDFLLLFFTFQSHQLFILKLDLMLAAGRYVNGGVIEHPRSVKIFTKSSPFSFDCTFNLQFLIILGVKIPLTDIYRLLLVVYLCSGSVVRYLLIHF